MPFLPAIHHPQSHIRDLYAHSVLSDQPWEPIFNIRSRPPWVQIVAFDLFKLLTPMRYKPCTLPPLETLSIPLEKQARVEYGDLTTLCDTIVSPLPCSPEATTDGDLTPMKLGILFSCTRSSCGCIRGRRREGYAVDQILQGMPPPKSQKTRF